MIGTVDAKMANQRKNIISTGNGKYGKISETESETNQTFKKKNDTQIWDRGLLRRCLVIYWGWHKLATWINQSRDRKVDCNYKHLVMTDHRL